MTRKSDLPVRKIAFVGTASSGAKAPYDDPSWEIWGVSARPEYVTRATRWFEIHRLDGEPQDWANAWRESVRTFSKDVELMMFYPEPDLGPNVVQYPVDRIVDKFGTFFMSSTFAWMMALALDEVKEAGVRAEFAVYGVDMEYGTEYCVSPETRVLTADLRWVPAGSVSPGDGLIGFDETSTKRETRQWQHTTVKAANRLTRPCYRLYMEDGTELVSSAEHRWLTWGGHEFKWKRTDQMVTSNHRSGRPTRICKPLNAWDRPFEGWDAGYVAAAIDGEGHIGQGDTGHRRGDLRIGFSQRGNAMSHAFEAALARLGYGFSKTEDATGCQKYILRGTRNEMLEFLGRLRPPRIMSKFDPSKLGAMRNLGVNTPAVMRSEYLGEQEVVALTTGTGTFIAEGYASHNSNQRAGFRHFVALARDRGIPVHMLASTGLAYDPVPYPMWQDDPLLNKLELRHTETQRRLQTLNESLRRTRTLIAQNRAVSEALYELDADADLVATRLTALDREHKALMDTSAGLSKEIVHWDAINSEQDWLADYLKA